MSTTFPQHLQTKWECIITVLSKRSLSPTILNFLIKNNPDLKILYVTCEKFTRDYVESLKNSKSLANAEYKEKYKLNFGTSGKNITYNVHKL